MVVRVVISWMRQGASIMINANRFLFTAGLLGALVGGWRYCDSGRLGEMGLDLWDLPNSINAYHEFKQKGEALDQEEKIVLDHLQRKNQLIKDLVAGRVTLQETAGGFMQLNEDSALPKAGYIPFPGASREEKYCRQVIGWVKCHRMFHPKDVDETFLVCLEDELAELVARGSAMITPPSDVP
jgi:hypothetical protein